MERHQCVCALIVDQHTILLGRRSPTRDFYPDVWDLFGGHTEPGEQPEQTLIRELHEELGIVPTVWRHLATIVACDVARHQDIHLSIYLVLAWAGVPTNRQPDEHTLIQWFTLEEAGALELAHPAYPRLFAHIRTTALPPEN